MLILDSGPLIILSNCCLLNILEFLYNKGIKFCITPTVYKETVEKPIKNEYYMWSAIRIKKIIDKYIEIREVDLEDWDKIANSCFTCEGRYLEICHKGELEALVLANKIKPYILVMDERTTRLLLEDPHLLKCRLERKFKGEIKMIEENILKFQKEFHKVLIIRTAELYLLARKLGYPGNKNVDYGILFSLKKNGCGISTTEIIEYFEQ